MRTLYKISDFTEITGFCAQTCKIEFRGIEITNPKGLSGQDGLAGLRTEAKQVESGDRRGAGSQVQGGAGVRKGIRIGIDPFIRRADVGVCPVVKEPSEELLVFHSVPVMKQS